MNETNLTQHGRSTDVNASDILYPISIIMVYVTAALIIKALKYELEN